MRCTSLWLVLILASRYTSAGNPEPPIPTAATDEGIARSVSIDVSSNRSSFKPLEPVVLSIRAENRSGQHLFVVGNGRTLYTTVGLHVYDSSGRRIPRTRFEIGKLDGPDSSGQPSAFDADSRLTGRLVANLIYDMTEPGEYLIVADLRFFRQGDRPGKVETAHSKLFKVRIVRELPVPDDSAMTPRLSP